VHVRRQSRTSMRRMQCWTDWMHGVGIRGWLALTDIISAVHTARLTYASWITAFCGSSSCVIICWGFHVLQGAVYTFNSTIEALTFISSTSRVWFCVVLMVSPMVFGQCSSNRKYHRSKSLCMACAIFCKYWEFSTFLVESDIALWTSTYD